MSRQELKMLHKLLYNSSKVKALTYHRCTFVTVECGCIAIQQLLIALPHVCCTLGYLWYLFMRVECFFTNKNGIVCNGG